MGQEVIGKQSDTGVYFYKYTDGSVRKVGKFDVIK